jgi:hypothetical protein
MSLAYIVPGGLNDDPGVGLELYRSHPGVRLFYEQVHEWTSWAVNDILTGELPEHPNSRLGFGAIRQAAAVISWYDVLAEQKIYPHAITGISDVISATFT